jgi:DNA-dependent RNA polymerase auxiliary subunit epsilon
VVPEEEKMSLEYGLQVARAIEGEWFNSSLGGYRYENNYNIFYRRRLYARGEQPVQKYKDELSINGDLSYLNLDWKPVPIIPKFVDIVVNGMSSKLYDIKAFAQDPASQKARTDYARHLHKRIATRAFREQVKASLGVDINQAPPGVDIPQTEQELELHMQLDYKQSIEIAEEEAISNVLARNKYDLVRKRFNRDLTVLGIGAVKTSFNKANGIVVDYVDPANLVWSYTEDPNFEDVYYVGEVKSISVPELKKEFPDLTDDQLAEIQKFPGTTNYTRNWQGNNNNNTVQVLYFEYKTYADQVFKIKHTDQGLEKAIEKTDIFNPPPSDNFDRVSRSIEVLYHGAKILGHPIMLKWEVAENMTRPFSNLTKVEMNYQLCAPTLYKGRISSLVERMIGFADMIQLTSLKLQQVLARVVPDGVFLDVDGLAEVDLGNGTHYNPSEALNMYFQTGSIVGRSMTQDGDLNHGKVPIQELNSSSGGQKIQSLIQTYQYYLQMIRDVTGLNEARDASTPDKDALVGLQKLAAAQSNVATRHLLQASLFLTLRACENIALRISDCLEFDLTREALIDSISAYNVGTLEELQNLNLFDFGIFLELEPDEEEKAVLEQNIQMAIQQGGINLEDAIDIRQVKNLKLANQLLKLKRKQNTKAAQEAQQANIRAQAEAQTRQREEEAMFEVQKKQALNQTNIEFEKAKSQFEIERLQIEANIKREILEVEFAYDMQLEKQKMKATSQKEVMIEDRKDKRSKQEATQQSQLINQSQNDDLPQNFETPINETDFRV